MRQSRTKAINERAVSLDTETYDLLIIAEAEVVLYDKVLIFLDFILVHLTLLHFRKVPGNDVLPGRSHNRVFFLSLTDVKPGRNCQSLLTRKVKK